MATEFSNTLKRLRKSKGITQAELAKDLGVSKSTISMYEIGAREPDFETLEALADYFNVDMNYLTGWSDDPINYDDPELLASIPLSYMEACNGDARLAWRMMQAVDEDAKKDSIQQKLKDQIKKLIPLMDEPEITFDDFTYAFLDESKELTEENKQKLLEMAKFFKQQQDKQQQDKEKNE